MAKDNGAKIKYIFETHFHADFVSGHVDLAEKTGADIVYGPTANTKYNIIVAEDNQEFKLGNVTLKLIHTPGHTLESSSILLIDENGKDNALFSGDALFLGDVGRPDLAVKTDLTREDLAGMLFDSLRNKIMRLADDVILYPAHGAGSSCGKNMSTETVGTIGGEKATNYALRADMTKEEFIKEVTTGILPPPQYFPKNAGMNVNGTVSFDEVMIRGQKPLNLNEFKKEINNGALILDVRNEFDFAKGFIPNSLFIGLDGTFAMWVGALIQDIHQEIILIVDEGKEEEAITRLARVGYDNAVGFLNGGVEAWDGELNTIDSVTPEELNSKIEGAHIVDVRKPGENASEHVVGSLHYPLDYMNDNLDVLSRDKKYYIHCAGGYRSVIAISLLMQNGITDLVNILGGFDAIKKVDIPKSAYICPSEL